MLLAIAQVGASALVVPPVGARSLGTLEISEAGLGTLNLALDKTEDPAAADALRSAVASGCNFLDVRSRFELASPHSPNHNYPRPDFDIWFEQTAEAYGFGSSERLTAWAAAQAGVKIGTGPGELHVATKFAPVPWRADAASVVDVARPPRPDWASSRSLSTRSISLTSFNLQSIRPREAEGRDGMFAGIRARSPPIP